MIFSSHSNIKYSYHIVVTGVTLASNREARLFAKTVVDAALGAGVAATVVAAADFGVYSATQQFRIAGCQKYGSGRIKTFRPELSGWNVPESARQPDIRIFMDSLITNLSGCSPPPNNSLFGRALEAEAALQMLKLIRTPGCFGALAAGSQGAPVFLGGDEAAAALDAVCSRLRELGAPTTPFRLRDAFGPFESSTDSNAVLIPLNRDAPSFCPTCQRGHETENPFMTIWSGADGGWNAAFCCRRSDHKVVVPLGKSFVPSVPESAPPRLTRQILEKLSRAPQVRGSKASAREPSDDLYRTITTTYITDTPGTPQSAPFPDAECKAVRRRRGARVVKGCRNGNNAPPIIPQSLVDMLHQL